MEILIETTEGSGDTAVVKDSSRDAKSGRIFITLQTLLPRIP